MKTRVLAALALGLAALGPVACGSENGGEQAAPTANPDAPSGISVSNARLSLPPVAGNPAAVYFDIANNGDQDAMIAGAFVEGAAMASLHHTTEDNGVAAMHPMEELPVPAGETARFAPGGMHVMAEGLAPALTAGGTAEVTLTFASGDKVSFPAEIRSAGDAR
jgi:periplasmic copper chaperone A